eukprot:2402393-Rhodomonas_salina.5
MSLAEYSRGIGVGPVELEVAGSPNSQDAWFHHTPLISTARAGVLARSIQYKSLGHSEATQ